MQIFLTFKTFLNSNFNLFRVLVYQGVQVHVSVEAECVGRSW